MAASAFLSTSSGVSAGLWAKAMPMLGVDHPKARHNRES
jgi:hypothetical protein